MLSCEQVIQGLRAFLDKDCKQGDAAQIKEHLELCRACFSRSEFEQLLKEEIKKKTDCICPEKVKARIKSILDHF
jgi:anti-sigma factor (TIGR02949 family)